MNKTKEEGFFVVKWWKSRFKKEEDIKIEIYKRSTRSEREKERGGKNRSINNINEMASFGSLSDLQINSLYITRWSPVASNTPTPPLIFLSLQFIFLSYLIVSFWIVAIINIKKKKRKNSPVVELLLLLLLCFKFLLFSCLSFLIGVYMSLSIHLKTATTTTLKCRRAPINLYIYI